MAIPPARLVSKSKPRLVPGKLLVTELWFEVPLDYAKPDGRKLQLFARTARSYERPIVEKPAGGGGNGHGSGQQPFLVYLQGGPGFGNPTPQASPLSPHMLARGYEMLFLDYRGVGLSSTLDAAGILAEGGPQAQADYLKHFRADNVVRDSEAVRRLLTADYPPELQKWSIFGQSFGGMTSFTYLSFHPEGLREVYVTGGVPALDKGPEEIYRQTYSKVVVRSQAYYNKYPEDVAAVKQIASEIRRLGGEAGVILPTGGRLTVGRLLSLGIELGFDGGLDTVHDSVMRMKSDLDRLGRFTWATLNAFEQYFGWDAAPIYSLLHEPCWIYGPGVAGNWAAERVGKSLDTHQWLREDWAGPESMAEGEPLYFSGEMVYSWFFDTCPGLRGLKPAAQILAEFDRWPSLYDPAQLARNEVPVYAAIYNDMYVDAEDSKRVASKVKNMKTWETNVHFHSALRAKSDEVLSQLFRLRDDTID